jgi:hypothetical protein
VALMVAYASASRPRIFDRPVRRRTGRCRAGRKDDPEPEKVDVQLELEPVRDDELDFGAWMATLPSGTQG